MGTFRSVDANADAPTWTLRGIENCCGNLGGWPDPADATAVFIGTRLGVYRLRDAWGPSPVIENASFNLPNAMVFAMGFSAANGLLRVATYGRGLLELRTDEVRTTARSPCGRLRASRLVGLVFRGRKPRLQAAFRRLAVR